MQVSHQLTAQKLAYYSVDLNLKDI